MYLKRCYEKRGNEAEEEIKKRRQDRRLEEEIKEEEMGAEGRRGDQIRKDDEIKY